MTDIKTTSRTVLRRMLRDCDRKLSGWAWWKTISIIPCVREDEMRAIDARRREIRRRLKERRDG